MKLKHTSFIATALLLGSSAVAQAALVSIIDSGTDLGHSQLKNKAWVNDADPDDALDNDDNGLVDDTHGWNFAEGNNKLYDKKLVGTFQPDIFTFFEVQTRILRGEGTQADQDWIEAHRQDEAFLKKLNQFGNWMHGTHVAGLAAKDASEAQIMPLKIIPTPVAAVLNDHVLRSLGLNAQTKNDLRPAIARKALALLAGQQSQTFAPIGEYVAAKAPQVANCSFGTSVKAMAPVLGPIVSKILGHEMDEAETNEYMSYFITQVMVAMQPVFIDKAPSTLFVIAAGNDGTDNDVLPTSPANIRTENTLTVAATLGVSKLASFSNYGATMVDVAAPGVGIKSSIPGEMELTVSGTSQAAPFVANIAARVIESNPGLALVDVKQIVMATVDAKAFLQGKVATGGTVNPDRAVFAAKKTLQMSVNDAIAMSMTSISEYQPKETPKSEGYVLPMTALFQ